MSDRRGDERRERVSARKRAEEHKSGFDRTIYRVPQGVNIFTIEKEGTYRFDVVPYIVPKGAKNPYREDGQLGFERTFFIHRAIGAEENSYVCPKSTAKLPCPICEARQKMIKETTPDDKEGLELIKALAPKERQLWNVYDHDNEDRGVQIFEYSYHLFGKQLDARVKAGDEDDGYEYFADPDDGSSLKVYFGEKSMGKNTFFEATSIDFKRRSEPLDKKILAAAQVLDNLLIIEPYDRLRAIFLQIPDEEGAAPPPDQDERPTTRSAPVSKPKDGPSEKAAEPTKAKAEPKPKPEPKPEPKKESPPTAESVGLKKGDEVVHKEHGPCTIFKISPDGTSLTLIDSDDNMHKAIGVVDVRKKASAAKEAKPKPEPKKESPPADDDDWGDGSMEDAAPAAAASDGDDLWD